MVIMMSMIMIMMMMTLMLIMMTMMMMILLMITKGIPSLAKSSFGPIPESISSLGLPTTPALKMIIIIMIHDLLKISTALNDRYYTINYERAQHEIGDSDCRV